MDTLLVDSKASLTSFLAFLVIFFLVDLIWVRVLSAPLWNAQVQKLTGKPLVVNGFAALLTYVLIALGLNYLVYPHATSAPRAAFYGALFGLVVYGVFDLTNLAIFQDYNVGLAILDILWGTGASALTSYLVYTFL